MTDMRAIRIHSFGDSRKFPLIGQEQLPIVLGRDVAGRVLECGSAVRYLRPGDDVFVLLDPINPHVDASYPLEQAAAAQDQLAQHHVQGKLVLQIGA